ncbi:MAG: PEP-CTERM sorting domain-containing protein [Verrucomicrobiota bacterium]
MTTSWTFRVAASAAVWAGLALSAPAAGAVTVDFSDVFRGPADSLFVDGVWATSGSVPGRPATVAGVGLGSDLVGAPGWIDCQLHYSPGCQFPDRQNGDGESLRLAVEGILNSVTVSIDAPSTAGVGLGLPFAISLATGGPLGSIFYQLINPGDSLVTISLPPWQQTSWIELGNAYEPGEFVFFDSYRHADPAPDQTIQFGFSVVSLDYVPVPEPALPGLLLLGAAGFLSRRR